MSDDEKKIDAEEMQKLTREYVDLWEQQIKALAGDADLAKTMAQTTELMNMGAANMAAMMQATGTKATETSETHGPEHGASSAHAASGNSKHDAGKLAARVAELEKRLNRLESLVEPTGKIAPRKT